MNQPKSNKQHFDVLAYLRKPHGMLSGFLILGIIAWAVWTFIVW